MATEYTLKLLVDKSTNRVLFAEATKEVVDILFGLLEMPLASVVKVLTTEKMVGSIGNLFQSVSNLDPIYLQSSQVKKHLLDPVIPSSASYQRLLLPAAATLTNYFTCPKYFSSFSISKCSGSYNYIANSSGLSCPECCSKMNSKVTLVIASDSNSEQSVTQEVTNGYVKEPATYTIMDDLVVTPLSTILSASLLYKYYSFKDVGVLIEEKNVKLGFDEGLQLLQASMRSRTVLSDVFLPPKSSSKSSDVADC